MGRLTTEVNNVLCASSAACSMRGSHSQARSRRRRLAVAACLGTTSNVRARPPRRLHGCLALAQDFVSSFSLLQKPTKRLCLYKAFAAFPTRAAPSQNWFQQAQFPQDL